MHEAIARNRFRSVVLVALLGGLLGMALFALAEAGEPGAGAVGLLAGFGITGIGGAVTWLAGDRALLWSVRARRIGHADAPVLHNVVEEMAIAAGLPLPAIYLLDDPGPNAFATGRSPATASIAVTSGLLACLDRDELQGVVAHEMGHIQNRDILFMTIASVMVGAIDVLADVAARVARHRGRVRARGRDRGGAVVLIIVAAIVAFVAPLCARLLYLGASREREYLADATGAFLTRNPDGLANALERISAAPVHASVNSATAALCIVNPRQMTGSDSWLSTHPATERRVEILRRMAGATYQAYEDAVRAATGKSVVPRGALGLAPSPAPTATLARGATPERAAAYHAARDGTRRRAGYRTVRCRCDAQIQVPADRAAGSLRCPRCAVALSSG